MKTTLEQAQELLNSRIDMYYAANSDGGSPDEIYAIAFRIARIFDIDINDLNF